MPKSITLSICSLKCIDKQKSALTQYVRTINIKTLRPNNDIKTLATITEDKKGVGEFFIRISEDGSKLLVASSFTKDKKANEIIELTMYDNKLNKLWERAATIPFVDKDYTLEAIKVANSGKVYIKGYEGKWSSDGLNYKVTAFYDEAKNRKNFAVQESEEQGIQSVTIAPDNSKDELAIAAFHYGGKGTDGVKGIYYMKIGSGGSLKSSTQHTFSTDLVIKGMSEKELKKNDPEDIGLENFSVDEIIMKPDGGAYILAEGYRRT